MYNEIHVIIKAHIPSIYSAFPTFPIPIYDINIAFQVERNTNRHHDQQVTTTNYFEVTLFFFVVKQIASVQAFCVLGIFC